MFLVSANSVNPWPLSIKKCSSMPNTHIHYQYNKTHSFGSGLQLLPLRRLSLRANTLSVAHVIHAFSPSVSVFFPFLSLCLNA